MATAKQYDETIGPMMLEVAKKAAELGMTLVARVEWKPDAGEITHAGPITSASQRLTLYAAHSGGNIDLMLMRLLNSGADCSESAFLRPYVDRKK